MRKKFSLKTPNFTKYIFPTTIGLISFSFGWLVWEIRRAQTTLRYAFDAKLLEQIDSDCLMNANKSSYVYINNTQEYIPGIFRLWQSFWIQYSLRLLNVAQCEDENYRKRATKALANIKYLREWDYKYLAQRLDASTAVALARHENSDLRLFLGPPNRLVPNYARLVKCIKHFMLSLNERAYHPCLPYCICTLFQERTNMNDDESSFLEFNKELQTTDAILPTCLKTILHHAYLKEENAADIVRLNGLPLLMEVHQRYPNNIQIAVVLASIIATITQDPSMLNELFRTGWIGVLAKWARNPDLRLSATAAQALANLDIDVSNETFSKKVFLLYPYFRKINVPKIDVILVHGLLGGVFFTWRQRDRKESTALGLLGKKGTDTKDKDKNKEESVTRYSDFAVKKSTDPMTQMYMEVLQEYKQTEWEDIGRGFEMVLYDCPEMSLRSDDIENYTFPESTDNFEEEVESSIESTQCWPRDWLSKDVNGVRIIGLNYETNISLWSPMCPAEKTKLTLEDRSKDFMAQLIKAGVGKRPILWVCHSMGGLVVKNMLVNALHHGTEREKDILDSTRGIIFYSTPHRGSRTAAINQVAAIVTWPTMEVMELCQNSPALLKLHENFKNLLIKFPMKIITFVENKATVISALHFNLRFVERDSADPGVGKYFEIPLDHLNICKPRNKKSFLYQQVLQMVRELCNNDEKPKISHDSKIGVLHDLKQFTSRIFQQSQF